MSHAVLLGAFSLASSIWIGGYVAIGVVARVATRTLEPGQRVAFFRGLGRSYLAVGGPALLVALGTGAGLLAGHRWDGTLIAAAVLAATLLASLAVGVMQARRMTRVRARALTAPQDPRLAGQVRSGARGAALLRAAIGLLTGALIAVGAMLAT